MLEFGKLKIINTVSEDIVCIKCNILKSKDNYRYIKDKNGKNYISRTCRDCKSAYHKINNYNAKRDSLSLKERRKQLLNLGLGYCITCNKEKNISEFKKSETIERGYKGVCNSCQSDKEKFHKLKKNYNISKEQYYLLLKEQEHKCKVCKTEFNEKICVDHCHTTGKIRGLLCDNCNRGIGLLKDNKQILENAVLYLDSSCKIPLNGEHPNKDNPVLN